MEHASPAFQQLLEIIRTLPQAERAEIVNQALLSFEEPESAAAAETLEAEWRQELALRLERLKDGRSKPLSHEEFWRRVREHG